MTSDVKRRNNDDDDAINQIENYLRGSPQNLLTFISIDGNIGIGKSTFLEKLKKGFSRPNTHFLPEPVNEWVATTTTADGHDSIFELYYKDRKKFAQLFQSIILISFSIKFSNILHNYIHQRGPDKEKWPLLIISERSILSALHIFVPLLVEDKFISENFRNDYIEIFNRAPYPDIILYLRDGNIEKLMSRIKTRNRVGEDGINVEYLVRIQNKYDKVLEYYTNRKNNCCKIRSFNKDESQHQQQLVSAILAIVVEEEENQDDNDLENFIIDLRKILQNSY